MSQRDPARQAGSIGVVGGGIIGLSVAWRLAQSGWKVVVFDQNTTGSEASWAAAGMLAPGGEYDESSPLVAYGLASRLQYRAFIDELQDASGSSIDFQENGALELAYSAEELADLEEKAARQHNLGILSKPLDLQRVHSFWPRVRQDGLRGARFYPDDATVNPREMTAALKIACERLGVEINENSAATGIRIDEKWSEITSASGAGNFDSVVIAAGAWSGSVVPSGVPPIPVSKPVKGHLVGYHQPEQTCATIVRHKGVYLLQRASGLLIAGASVEDAGFDRTVESRVASEISARAAGILPHLAETTPTEVWIGFRPGGALHVGPWVSPRLWLSYGHYRNGILLAPWTARKLSDEINASLKTL